MYIQFYPPFFEWLCALCNLTYLMHIYSICASVRYKKIHIESYIQCRSLSSVHVPFDASKVSCQVPIYKVNSMENADFISLLWPFGWNKTQVQYWIFGEILLYMLNSVNTQFTFFFFFICIRTFSNSEH